MIRANSGTGKLGQTIEIYGSVLCGCGFSLGPECPRQSSLIMAWSEQTHRAGVDERTIGIYGSRFRASGFSLGGGWGWRTRNHLHSQWNINSNVTWFERLSCAIRGRRMRHSIGSLGGSLECPPSEVDANKSSAAATRLAGGGCGRGAARRAWPATVPAAGGSFCRGSRGPYN